MTQLTLSADSMHRLVTLLMQHGEADLARRLVQKAEDIAPGVCTESLREAWIRG